MPSPAVLLPEFSDPNNHPDKVTRGHHCRELKHGRGQTPYSALSLLVEPILKPAHEVGQPLIRKSRRIGVALREDCMAARTNKIDSRSAHSDRSISHALLDLVA